MSFVAGIDVGGVKRGFHVAVLNIDSDDFVGIRNFHAADGVVGFLSGFRDLKCIAIDCPPKAQILGPRTRLAERQINQAGFKVQWTRRVPMPPDEWMLNGETVWEAVLENFKEAQVIETFPTVVSGRLKSCDLKLPLNLMVGGVRERFGYKDSVDACICAWVAQKYLRGEAISYGSNKEETDELGLIWI